MQHNNRRSIAMRAGDRTRYQDVPPVTAGFDGDTMDGPPARRRALIAGGGIGGLVAALALDRAGLDVTVFEAAQEIRPLGVGINLQPHAVLVLAELGLIDALRETGIETGALLYVNKFGQRIWHEPRGIAAGYPIPQFSIHRGELHAMLHRAVVDRLGAGAVRCGAALVDHVQDDDGVVARFADRRGGTIVAVERGDLLVGADGIHSTLRRAMYPDEGPPCFSGTMLWRAVTEVDSFLDGRTMVWAGHASQKFVAYPISAAHARDGRALVNWIAELRVRPVGDPDRSPPVSDWNRRVDASVFAGPFASWDFDWLDVPAMIDRAGAAYEFPMVDRDPLPHWTVGRVTLLGDAAHPMYPIGSNGASQAILDARELADRLAEDDVPAALARYDAARRPTTAAIVAANRRQGPDEVMQIAEERAPHGFSDIHDVIPEDELARVASKYKQTAGFDREAVERALRRGAAANDDAHARAKG
jgi:5-methylphenazine-1-carboxylate 1-monooxygenase